MASPYSFQWKKFKREPVFEVLRYEEPWNVDLPIPGKLHFSFGVRTALAILQA
jgi:hypothetical protein